MKIDNAQISPHGGQKNKMASERYLLFNTYARDSKHSNYTIGNQTKMQKQIMAC